MKFSAGAGVCPNAAKATTSAAPKPTAFQPANMRLIIPPAFVSVHLLCGRNRFGARGPGFTAERQLEFLGNLRPEFAQHIETHVLQDAVAHALRCWRETAFVVHVIRIAQRDRARRPQPFGKIEHAPAIIAVRHHRVFHRMEQSPPAAAARQPVVTRVFGEYRGVRKVLEEPGGGLIGEFGAKAPPIALCPLSITVVRVLRLVNPRAEAGGEKRHRVKGILDEQDEFIFQLERAQYRAGLVVRGVHRFAFQRPGERAHDLLQRPVIIFYPHHRRRLNARCRPILHGFLRQRRSGYLLRRSWRRRLLRANHAASHSAQRRQDGRSCQNAKTSSVSHGIRTNHQKTNNSTHCDHFVGVRSHRCFRSSPCSGAGNGPRSLAAVFASTLEILRIPGIIVLTSLLFRINRSAISAMLMPPRRMGLSASTCSTVLFRFSVTKYVLRQSPAGHLLSSVSEPASEPSSNGTRAITATSFSRHAGNNSSSGFWSKML